MTRLPSELAEQFPAINGMGAKQFSDSLAVMHQRRYEQLEVQYLQTIQSRAHQGQLEEGQTFKPFPEFTDRGEDGPGMYVPSGKWCRDTYDTFIESREVDFDKHTSQLSCKGGALDHSFKIVKHIGEVEGERVFEGLLTITNSLGQIRQCSLVTTKAQSNFSDALTEICNSFQLHGHVEPEVFFTDNIADKPMLERHFPSLTADLEPITKDSHLPELEIPVPQVVRRATEINDCPKALDARTIETTATEVD
ncbi:hypothetical protein PQX77_013965 [Marasmius sp. AFHP31]|nr:hypothetical protein PQX77_013965 [Marasmius sp. AFHP31]